MAMNFRVACCGAADSERAAAEIRRKSGRRGVVRRNVNGVFGGDGVPLTG